MLSAEPIPAEEAKAMGLVYRVFDDATFRDEVGALAGRLAQGPALAYRLTKQAVAKSLDNDLETQLTLEAELQRQAGFSDDFFEGIAAFREKRAPRFSDR
jgi:2-(1,2-epoxy-1,2-dihydrophenyl)acetyl-CoA isomerase